MSEPVSVRIGVGKYGIDKMVVRIRSPEYDDGGRILTAFPTDGPAVDTWTRKTWE